jgi:hypothetical protein
VAALSTPAKTVTTLSGNLEFCKAIFTAGLAPPAAQPHTELIITNTVPSFLFKTSSTSSGVFSSNTQISVNSARIGATKASGYISLCLDNKTGKNKELFKKTEFIILY